MVDERSAMMPQIAVIGALTFAPRPTNARILCSAPPPNERLLMAAYRKSPTALQARGESLPSSRHRQLWEDALDFLAVRLEPRRQNQRFAEMRGIFINCETWTVRRKFKENTARFLEVNRLEPEAIDHRSRSRASLFNARPHFGLMF